jgi:type IV pilus assembly protein PilQ
VRPLETRLIKLNYANAKELQGVVQSILSRRGQIQVDDRTNTIVVSDVPEVVAQAERMATGLDQETPQIEIVAKLVDVDVSSLREFGVNWLGRAFNIGNTTDTFEEFDIIAEVSDPVLRFKIGTLTNPGQLELELQALELQRKANIISNPRITTVDNREAKIVVGQKIPLIVQDVAGNAVSQLTTIGIQLQVTPHLTADRKIVMDIHPEVSDLSTQSTVQGGIIINTSEADTRVMVDDGQTAVIGGLIRDNTGRVKTGIPVLMDVPLLGFLFSSTSDVEQKRELVIFVTPSLVQSQ